MKLRYAVLAWLALMVAFITMIPTQASKPCLLGYAHCSWIPWSTLICLVIAGAIMWIGEKRS